MISLYKQMQIAPLPAYKIIDKDYAIYIMKQIPKNNLKGCLKYINLVDKGIADICQFFSFGFLNCRTKILAVLGSSIYGTILSLDFEATEFSYDYHIAEWKCIESNSDLSTAYNEGWKFARKMLEQILLKHIKRGYWND